MDISKFISKIIPPADYQHRNGFDNVPLLNELSNSEKQEIEYVLLEKLKLESPTSLDCLIAETLAYLKSKKSIPIMKDFLNYDIDEPAKLIIYRCIFEISGDPEMVEPAISLFKKMDNKADSYYIYKLIAGFYELAKFGNAKANQAILEYVNHLESLLSYNARRALGIQK